jgi:NAD(P)-dependent dehydrogenase (short-subunit alcohol dehydrogenase family)
MREETENLDGRVAVVTGAGRGLGRAVALALAARGAAVVVNDTGGAFTGEGTDDSVAASVASEIVSRGGTAVASTDSVAQMLSAQRIVDTALASFGAIDILVNNAGITRQNMLWDMSEAEFDAVVATHLKGTYACMKAAIPHMRAQRSGSIVNMSSGVSVVGSVATSNYCAAKAGIIGLSFGAAMELGPFGIRVNVIFPAGHTRLHTKYEPWRDVYRVQERPEMPDDRWPAEAVTPLVSFLASDASTGVNGQLFTAGGNSVGLYGPWTIDREVVTDSGEPWDEASLEPHLPNLLEGIVNPSPPQPVPDAEIIWPWVRPGALPSAHDPTR